jgi:trigger factor
MKAGESKTFLMAFPADYHGKEVAGKNADFMVTLKKVEAAHLPEVNEALAKSLGIAAATVEGLRADIRKNLEREVKFRLLSRNKHAVMDALVAKAELDLPNASVQGEIKHLMEAARADLKQRGVKDADKTPLPEDIFRAQAERRVRLGLVVAELVRTNALQARSEQVKAHIEEMAASYEKPSEVLRWYYSDDNRLAEVEAIVTENNVTEFVMSQVKISEKSLSFDELMGQS